MAERTKRGTNALGKSHATKSLGTPKAVKVATPAARKAPARSTRAPADDPLSTERVKYLLNLFSGKRLAEWVGVSTSQTSRWSNGAERPSVIAAPILIDLEHVYARARLVWGDEAARIWLDSPNVHLGGPRPLEVLRTDGPARVLECLDAETWGGAA